MGPVPIIPNHSPYSYLLEINQLILLSLHSSFSQQGTLCPTSVWKTNSMNQQWNYIVLAVSQHRVYQSSSNLQIIHISNLHFVFFGRFTIICRNPIIFSHLTYIFPITPMGILFGTPNHHHSNKRWNLDLEHLPHKFPPDFVFSRVACGTKATTHLTTNLTRDANLGETNCGLRPGFSVQRWWSFWCSKYFMTKI